VKAATGVPAAGAAAKSRNLFEEFAIAQRNRFDALDELDMRTVK
jgi:hypothetical protein